MNKHEAFQIAQLRADRFGHTCVVYTVRGDDAGYRVTRDRPDLPDEWTVIGYCEPRREGRCVADVDGKQCVLPAGHGGSHE